MLTKKLINKYNPPRIKYYLVFNTIKTYKKKGKINYQHGSKQSLFSKKKEKENMDLSTRLY